MAQTYRGCRGCSFHSFHCQEANLRRCTGCLKVSYCSTECRDNDWVEHIFECKPGRPINTADYLARAVRQDMIPSHPQTREDYGFNRTLTDEDETNLMGLYIGLIKILEVPPMKIHKWRAHGVLADKIKTEYHKVPRELRGAHFSWFLRNEHVVVLAGQPLFPQPDFLSVSSFLQGGNAAVVHAWRFIGGSTRESPEEIRVIVALKPDEEKCCFWLYVLLLSNLRPAPVLDLWVDFGFVACTSEEEELELCARYRQLMTLCTFGEICDAHRTHGLLNLFRSKGLQVNDHRNLRDLLCSNTKSVWYLKQSVYQEDCMLESGMHTMVLVDYGFFNCKNNSETRELKRAYKAFFDSPNRDPLALHQAAIEGNIHGYISAVVPSFRGSKFRQLMENPYPLPDD